MSNLIQIIPLTKQAFAPFGDVMDASGAPDKMINEGLCGRHHDQARMDFSNGRAGISIFNAQARALPYALDMMERHPDGSQAFLPMHQHPYLVIVAADANGKPDTPIAFHASAGQGINYHRNVWHGVLCPLHNPGLFGVIDYIGTSENLETFWFDDPWIIDQP